MWQTYGRVPYRGFIERFFHIGWLMQEYQVCSFRYKCSYITYPLRQVMMTQVLSMQSNFGHRPLGKIYGKNSGEEVFQRIDSAVCPNLHQ